MSLKEFLTPDWRKILISVILFLFLAWSFVGLDAMGPSTILETYPTKVEGYGLPLHHTVIDWGGYIEGKNGPPGAMAGIAYNSNSLYFILDLLFWAVAAYLISCFIVWGYGKYKKKPEKKRRR